MTSSQSRRPTMDLSRVLLDSLDDMVDQLLERLDGLDDAEYLWEPVADSWTVRVPSASSVEQMGDAAAQGIVDMSDDRDIDPAPVTTIAWRLWHLSVDCFDDYTRRLGGLADDIDADRSWFLHATPAIEALRTSWTEYRATLTGRGDFWSELGDAWGPWAQHCVGDMAMHASNELVHHGAEIALLRDLYRAGAAD